MSSSIVIDIILGIICISILIKYSIKGFLKTILDFARLALSVVLAIMLRGVVADMFNSMFMSDSIYNWVYGSISGSLNGDGGAVDFVKIYNVAPEFFRDVLSTFDRNYSYEELAALMEELNSDTAGVVSGMIATPLANMLSTILAVLAIFIVSMIVLFFVVKLLNSLTKIKGINIINRILGIAFGALLSAVIVWGLSFVIELLVDMFGPMYPDIFNESLTQDSMIIGLFREAGLLDIFEGVKSQISSSI